MHRAGGADLELPSGNLLHLETLNAWKWKLQLAGTPIRDPSVRSLYVSLLQFHHQQHSKAHTTSCFKKKQPTETCRFQRHLNRKRAIALGLTAVNNAAVNNGSSDVSRGSTVNAAQSAHQSMSSVAPDVSIPVGVSALLSVGRAFGSIDTIPAAAFFLAGGKAYIQSHEPVALPVSQGLDWLVDKPIPVTVLRGGVPQSAIIDYLNRPSGPPFETMSWFHYEILSGGKL